MTLVYSFLTLFLFIMAGIIASQTEKSNYVEFVNNKVNEDIESLKEKSSSITKRLLEDNFVTDGSMFNYAAIANKTVGNGNGLYFFPSVDEDGDTKVNRVYFFRGSVDNNYAKIGNMCFKIIRTNEDGNVRMIYIGKSSGNNCNSAAFDTNDNKYLQNKKYNLLNNDNAFVGYMFGKAESQLNNVGLTNGNIFSNRIGVVNTAQKHTRYQDTHNYYEYDLLKGQSVAASYDSGYRFFFLVDNRIEYFENESNAKKMLDSWYEANTPTLSTMVKDAIYCTNRKPTNGTVDNTGYGNITTYYNMNNTGYSPSTAYRCEQEQDRLSLSISLGGTNEAYNSLKYPVGLLTTMDAVYAGGVFSSVNDSYYLNMGRNYWTMSPYSFSTTASEAVISSNGSIGYAGVTSESAYLYPVISIDGGTLVTTGRGTKAAPYILESSGVSYTIEYRGNGATNGTMISTVLKLDEESKLRKNTYTKEGYRFRGWTTQEEIDKEKNNSTYQAAIKYADEATVKNLTYTKGDTIVLYASWQKE